MCNLNLAPGANQINGQLQVGSVSETVEVSASTEGMNTTTLEVSSSLGKLPVANRAHVGVGSGSGGGMAEGTFRNRLTLSPGAVENSIGGMEAAASGQGLGDLFEYKLKDRVTLKKNQSALVPIVQTDLDAEKVSLLRGTTRSRRPLRAIWMKNTSVLTRDGGRFNVLESEGLPGER